MRRSAASNKLPNNFFCIKLIVMESNAHRPLAGFIRKNDPFAKVDRLNLSVDTAHPVAGEAAQSIDPVRYFHGGGDHRRLYFQLDRYHDRRGAPAVRLALFLRRHLRAQNGSARYPSAQQASTATSLSATTELRRSELSRASFLYGCSLSASCTKPSCGFCTRQSSSTLSR